MNLLFSKYLSDLENNNYESEIYRIFLDDMNSKYKENNSNKRIVIDFIAGMTDDYFMKQVDKIINC